MFNVTILKFKDLIKYIAFITIAIVAIVFLIKITDNKSFIESLSKTVPTVFKTEEKVEEVPNTNETDYMKNIIKTQISSIDEAEESTKESVPEEAEPSKEENNLEVSQDPNNIPDTAPTEVVTQNPIQEKFNV